MRRSVCGVNEYHTVFFDQLQNGSSTADVARVVFCTWLYGKSVTSIGVAKSSLVGGAAEIRIAVNVVSTLSTSLSPLNVTRYEPAWPSAGSQENVPVLLPLSTNVAPCGIPFALSVTCRPCVSAALTLKDTRSRSSAFTAVGAVISIGTVAL